MADTVFKARNFFIKRPVNTHAVNAECLGNLSGTHALRP
jgi:hypothetical protein